MDEEQSLEDKLAWRKKISNVDASLRSALEDPANKKGRFPMLSRKKSPKPDDAKPDVTSSKPATNPLQLGVDSSSS